MKYLVFIEKGKNSYAALASDDVPGAYLAVGSTREEVISSVETGLRSHLDILFDEGVIEEPASTAEFEYVDFEENAANV
jgi:predicted RNase H-like HicB family nuclease